MLVLNYIIIIISSSIIIIGAINYYCDFNYIICYFVLWYAIALLYELTITPKNWDTFDIFTDVNPGQLGGQRNPYI